MLHTATIRCLGTMPNAEIRIRTPYAAAPCGSVTKIALKDLEKYDPRDAAALRAGFSLILGLVGLEDDVYPVVGRLEGQVGKSTTGSVAVDAIST